MRWEVETWRKLYVSRSAEWLMLDLSARGLGTELLKYCDDDGRIPLRKGEAPAVAIALLLCARPHEHVRVTSDVTALLDVRYLELGDGWIRIRNFAEAQHRRTGSAERMARMRQRRREDSAEISQESTGADRHSLRHSASLELRHRVADPDPDPDIKNLRREQARAREHAHTREWTNYDDQPKASSAAADLDDQRRSVKPKESFEGYSGARVSDAVHTPSTGTVSPSDERDSDAHSRVDEPEDASEAILGGCSDREHAEKTSAVASHVAKVNSPPLSYSASQRAPDPMAMRRRIVAVLGECDELRGHIEDFDAFARVLQGQAGFFREDGDAPLDEVTHYACLQLTTEVSQGKHKRPGTRAGIVRAIFRRLLNADELARARGDDDEPDPRSEATAFAAREMQLRARLARGSPMFGPNPPPSELAPIVPIAIPVPRFSGG